MGQPCIVINKYHHLKEVRDPNTVYIGRGSIWGNPFVLNRDGSRDEVCVLYEQYFWTTDLAKHLPELVGKKLECYCAPVRCHGDFLAKLVNEYESTGIIPEKPQV